MDILLVVASVSLASFSFGVVVGSLHQKRKSDEETHLLVSLWERMAVMREDIDTLLYSSHEDEEDTEMPLRPLLHVETSEKLQRQTQPLPIVEADDTAITQQIDMSNF